MTKTEPILYGYGMSGSINRFASLAAAWPTSCAAETGLVVRVDDKEAPDLRHTHLDFRALYVVRRGRGIHVVDGVPYGVARGDVYVMGAGATHGYSQNEELCLDAIYFRPDTLSTAEEAALSATEGFAPVLAGGEGGGKWLHLDPGGYGAVRAQFEELRREWQRGDATGALMCRVLLVRLLVTLSRAAAGGWPSRRVVATVAVADAVRLLDDRHGRPLRIADVAKEVGLCPDHLTVAFSAVMGRTPRDYLRHVRIERAKALLARSSLPVAEIALQTGFTDAPHFVRTFHAHTGQTPRSYRASACS